MEPTSHDPAPPRPRTYNVQPRKPAGNRKLLVPVFVPGTEDPVYSRKKKAITPGTIFLSAIITFYAFYATGNLPEGEHIFDQCNAFLRARNDIVVNAILAMMPFIGILLFAVAVALFVLFHANRLRQIEDNEYARAI